MVYIMISTLNNNYGTKVKKIIAVKGKNCMCWTCSCVEGDCLNDGQLASVV